VVDKPLIQYAVEEAQAAGIEEFIFVTGRSKSAIEDHFDHSYELEETLKGRNKQAQFEAVTSWLPQPGQIAYTRQQEPLGLGHAVLCARHLVGDEPFAVLLADDLILADKACLRQMIDAHKKLRGNYVAVMDVPREHTNRYGILDVENDDGHLVRVKGVVEKPEPAKAPSTLSIIGRYILEPEVFEHLTRTPRGAGGEIQLTDALAQMIGSNQRPFMGLRFDGRRFDCGDKVGWLQANIAFALARSDMTREVRRILSDYC
ncbi:MAG TPA: UTP--glucose-1-phosphate uridylyltransferase, partial [Stellaceae bacterium]|nr:UTP--glucose-1-phosphate uridylyltransferase [Stellaceae bacterium]